MKTECKKDEVEVCTGPVRPEREIEISTRARPRPETKYKFFSYFVPDHLVLSEFNAGTHDKRIFFADDSFFCILLKQPI